jgi:hypothetical protein
VANSAPSASGLQQYAASHYMEFGHKEARVYRRLPVLLRYTACGGLPEQHYSHLAAATLAAAMGADLLLPQALLWASSAGSGKAPAQSSQPEWHSVPFDGMWDLAAIQRWAGPRRVCVCVWGGGWGAERA